MRFTSSDSNSCASGGAGGGLKLIRALLGCLLGFSGAVESFRCGCFDELSQNECSTSVAGCSLLGRLSSNHLCANWSCCRYQSRWPETAMSPS